MRMIAIRWNGFEQMMQCRHQIAQDWPHGRIEEVGCKIIYTELEGTKSLANQVGTSAEGMHERFHEVAEVWEQVGQTDGNSEGELHEKVALRVVARMLEEVCKRIEHLLQYWQNLLVKSFESTSAD